MQIVQEIRNITQNALHNIFQQNFATSEIAVNENKTEFEGEYTLVLFGLAKKLSLRPDEIGTMLGEYLKSKHPFITDYNIVKGFLNLVISPQHYIQFIQRSYISTNYGKADFHGKKIMIEYSSPNTNKPLHFGHLRNIFLGAAVANIAQAAGYEVIKANLINDRGIHICKSMIAWMQYANGATPSTTQIKGDHLVGDYYVKFNDVYKQEIEKLVHDGMSKEEAEKQAPIYLQAQDLLRKWEAGDKETLQLWQTMNDWVYDGFKVSYAQMGVTFDKMYYESNTYLLGKNIIEQGLAKGVFYKKEDGSVWIDLSGDGLDHKLLLRGDGTSVYITQDIGTAQLKYQDFGMPQSIYVIGDEQNYHMKVLKLILQKLEEPYADGVHHLSYGMVELPSGKMKSREGTVVDADDMMSEMISIAKQNTEALGKVDDFTNDELEALYHTLGLGALKFYLLRVDPKKKMIFNPEESIDFHGFTGPFVQYTHARICSILRKANDIDFQEVDANEINLTVAEKALLCKLETYADVILQAHAEFNPAVICNYIFSIAKDFNSFLVEHSVLKAENTNLQKLRLQICYLTRYILADGLELLGVKAPARM